MIRQELTYWVTLALIPKMWVRRKNEIYVKCFQHCPQISIVELFEDKSNWDVIGLNETEKTQFEEAKLRLPNNSFLVEELIDQGYDILPITHDDYPKLLKKNLKFNAPIVIYTKGNKLLLNESSVAIVGSRSATAISLKFTENVARKVSVENKVVVSGFAKGVDRRALDSAINANGKSIIVLPQGIMTFGTGFKQYIKHIVQGRVLVMSTFAPKAPWSVEFAMARNPIIYGMASEIFVAQSDDKGGTWAGVIDGLRKNRPIYVRYPESNENNANLLIIQKGASAVDDCGNVLIINSEVEKTSEQVEKEMLDASIINLLKSVDAITAKDIIIQLNLDWKDSKLKSYLEKMPQVEKKKMKNRLFYSLNGNNTQLELFDSQV